MRQPASEGRPPALISNFPGSNPTVSRPHGSASHEHRGRRQGWPVILDPQTPCSLAGAEEAAHWAQDPGVAGALRWGVL